MTASIIKAAKPALRVLGVSRRSIFGVAVFSFRLRRAKSVTAYSGDGGGIHCWIRSLADVGNFNAGIIDFIIRGIQLGKNIIF